MTTQILEGVDTDHVVVLDSSEDIPCMYIKETGRCTAPAEWAIIVTCCGGVYNFCQDCFDTVLDDCLEVWALRCVRCNVEHHPPSSIILSASKLDKR